MSHKHFGVIARSVVVVCAMVAVIRLLYYRTDLNELTSNAHVLSTSGSISPTCCRRSLLSRVRESVQVCWSWCDRGGVRRLQRLVVAAGHNPMCRLAEETILQVTGIRWVSRTWGRPYLERGCVRIPRYELVLLYKREV